MGEISEEGLGALCDHIVERRDAFSYMDVARAMCVRCHRREGREAARGLAERLEISPQTLWNWLNRDLGSWAAKMQAKREPARMGEELGYPARGRRISRDDLVMIAAFIRGKPRRPTSRQLRSDIRSLAMREPGWGHLKQISHSFLHRKRHVLNQMVADAEREEYFRKKAERVAPVEAAVSASEVGPVSEAAAAESAGEVVKSGEVPVPVAKPKLRPGAVMMEEI
ncbi:MAG: hypothetical protein C0518_13645 [Opitutus sp.]|nr:hypothetical protein [Opitutus sp.]